jgi:hypothetical protein
VGGLLTLLNDVIFRHILVRFYVHHDIVDDARALSKDLDTLDSVKEQVLCDHLPETGGNHCHQPLDLLLRIEVILPNSQILNYLLLNVLLQLDGLHRTGREFNLFLKLCTFVAQRL